MGLDPSGAGSARGGAARVGHRRVEGAFRSCRFQFLPKWLSLNRGGWTIQKKESKVADDEEGLCIDVHAGCSCS